MRSLKLLSVILGFSLSIVCVAEPDEKEALSLVPGFGGQVELIDEQLVLTLPKKIHFEFDSEKLEDFSSANDLISFMNAFKASLVLTIEGHTDNVGVDSYNKSLSERRALELKEFLVSQGIKEESVEIKAMSNARLIENTDKPSRVNRRLELSLSYK